MKTTTINYEVCVWNVNVIVSKRNNKMGKERGQDVDFEFWNYIASIIKHKFSSLKITITSEDVCGTYETLSLIERNVF